MVARLRITRLIERTKDTIVPAVVFLALLLLLGTLSVLGLLGLLCALPRRLFIGLFGGLLARLLLLLAFDLFALGLLCALPILGLLRLITLRLRLWLRLGACPVVPTSTVVRPHRDRSSERPCHEDRRDSAPGLEHG